MSCSVAIVAQGLDPLVGWWWCKLPLASKILDPGLDTVVQPLAQWGGSLFCFPNSPWGGEIQDGGPAAMDGTAKAVDAKQTGGTNKPAGPVELSGGLEK